VAQSAKLKRARRDTVRHFLNAKGGRATALTEQRVASINNAIPLTADPSVIEANALMATALATQIKVVSEIIKTYDERIETLFDPLPDAELFKSLPGMGPCMGRVCLPHSVITATALTAPKKFKTMLASRQ
jgi:hypothetical protein